MLTVGAEVSEMELLEIVGTYSGIQQTGFLLDAMGGVIYIGITDVACTISVEVFGDM